MITLGDHPQGFLRESTCEEERDGASLPSMFAIPSKREKLLVFCFWFFVFGLVSLKISFSPTLKGG
jgi:hypothetical protein